jgi:TRAP-type C4-dicarboxylate transport system permease small subunit
MFVQFSFEYLIIGISIIATIVGSYLIVSKSWRHFYVLLGVRYSPLNLSWKIAFYMGLIYAGVFLEINFEEFTQLIKYHEGWDAWTSYTW